MTETARRSHSRTTIIAALALVMKFSEENPMATARDIMRGTFRLSIAVAGLAAAYALYERSDAFEEAQNDSLRMTMRLECGARRSEENLKTATIGQIDLAEIGCASKPFAASFDELRKARDGGFRREWQAMAFDFAGAAQHALGYALVAFIAVNLLGLVVFPLRWIAAGHKPTR